MIIVRLIGGLGNQLFQYAIGRQLSLRKNVSLKLDISTYENNPDRRYALDDFNITAPVATNGEISKYEERVLGTSMTDRVIRKIRNRIPKQWKRYFPEGGYYQFEPALYKTSRNVLLEGFWQHHKYYEYLPKEIIEEFTIRTLLNSSEKTLLSQIAESRCPVAVHVRRGDYVSDINNLNYFGVQSAEYYTRASAYLNERISEPTYFVFSDDVIWARENLQLEAPTIFVEQDSEKRDFVDLLAMSKCKHNIIANSSFSWWGAFLNTNPNKIIIAPKNWLADKNLNNTVKIQMPSWIPL